MGISHFALRCFLTDAHPIRTGARTIASIVAGLHSPVSPELAKLWLYSDLSYLRPPLTAVDVQEIFQFVDERVRRREERMASE